MSMIKLEGLVLKGTDFSETSRIVTLWTREKGKMRAMAKGARRLKSPFENSLDLLNRCQFQLIHKSSGALDLLTESRVLESYGGLREHLPNLYAAYHVAELLNDGTQDLDPHPDLFDACLNILSHLSNEPVQARLPSKLSPVAAWELMVFELFYLEQTGYLPDFSHCNQCGQVPTPGQAPWQFSAEVGTISCETCSHKGHKQPIQNELERNQSRFQTFRKGAATHTIVTISPDALDVASNLGNREASTGPPSERVRAEVRALLNHYLTWLRGRRPKLVGFLGS